MLLPTLCPSCDPPLNAWVNPAPQYFIRTGTQQLAQITAADIQCSNGVVHVINAVLVPTNKSIPTLDVVQTASAAGLSSLAGALAATGLNATLSLGGTANSWTVFAPTNAAFAA